MNYITAEQFLSLSEKVQKVFLDWWEPEIGELYSDIDNGFEKDVYIIDSKNKLKSMKQWKNCTNTAIRPLFKLEQLWEFIEDTTGEYVEVQFVADSYAIVTTATDSLLAWEEDKLQAFWKAAVKVDSGNWEKIQDE